MSEVNFSPTAMRVRKAQAAHFLLKPFAVRAVRIVLLLSTVGAGGLFFISPFWAFITLAVAVKSILWEVWREGDLRQLDHEDVLRKGDSIQIDQQVEAEALRLLKGDVTSPKAVWGSLKSSWFQKFYAMRFGLALDILKVSLPEDKASGEALWRRAHDLSSQYDLPVITGGAIFVALIEQLPMKDKLLAHLGLTQRDLEAGIIWQHHISTMAKQTRKERNLSSIGRDWSSGYTPLLSRFALDITNSTQSQSWRREVATHKETIHKIIQLLAESRNANAAIIGEPGVGKTSLVRGLSQRLQTSAAPLRLRSYKVFEINAAQLIARAQQVGSIEGVVQALFAEANMAGNVILVFDDAESFIGGDMSGHIDISAMLTTMAERTRVPLLFSMTPKDWQRLQQARSPLASVLNPYVIKPSAAEEVMTILEDQAVVFEYHRKAIITYQALRESVRLSSEYVHDVAQPGASIRTLDSAMNFPQNSFITEKSVQQAVENSQGVKVQKVDKSEKEQLLNLEDRIHERLVNQVRAVSVVADALRRARSGVGSTTKPMGTFLFLGPTGVGKTELARALADVMFHGEDSIVRVDMNELSQPGSIERLLTVDPDLPDSLLSKIQRQPYSVVLLDEIEKADQSVLDVLLQMLDEGIMRDKNNREVSFRNAIVIATSNAGAHSIRQAVEEGRQVAEFEKEFLDSLISNGDFKPEFLNRFDETVVFRPLTQEELLKVVDILMQGVNKQLAQKQVTVELTLDAKQALVEAGYDARLGARPLRRVIQRAVESTIAEALLKDEITPGDHIKLSALDLDPKLDSR